MEAELRKKIDEILGPIYCPQGYLCFEPGVEHYRNDGEAKFVACVIGDPGGCAFAVSRRGARECRCVLRTTLLKKLH